MWNKTEYYPKTLNYNLKIVAENMVILRGTEGSE